MVVIDYNRHSGNKMIVLYNMQFSNGGDGMEVVQIIAIVLAAVGALNWGLVGLFNFDLVAFVAGGSKFGEVNLLSRIVYILVAIAGIVALTAIAELA